jgi:hypothetical protein
MQQLAMPGEQYSFVAACAKQDIDMVSRNSIVRSLGKN